jgi:hypothetical protein
MTRTTHQLTRWLMKEVHGIEIPRKPARRERAGPARNWRYRLWIRSLPCAVCGLEPCGEAAHTGDDGGLRQKSSDYSCIPLCPSCHTTGPAAYHVLGYLEFECRHSIDIDELVRRLNGLWFREKARRQA